MPIKLIVCEKMSTNVTYANEFVSKVEPELQSLSLKPLRKSSLRESIFKKKKKKKEKKEIKKKERWALPFYVGFWGEG